VTFYIAVSGLYVILFILDDGPQVSEFGFIH